MLFTLQPDDSHLLSMIQALPPVADNPVVKSARAACLGMIQGATPGGVNRDILSKNIYFSFRNTFFHDYSPAPYQDQLVPQVPWLDEKWWANFATALLSQAMLHILADSYSIILPTQAVDNDVDESNAQLMSVATRWYTYIFSQTFTDFTTPFHLLNTVLSDDDHPDPLGELRNGYIQVLTSDAWINDRNVMAQLGTWSDAAWEMYHHWIKLTIMGATDYDIGSVISQQQAKGLNVPNPDVTFCDNWANYLAWVNPLTWQEVQDGVQRGITIGGMLDKHPPAPVFFRDFLNGPGAKYGVNLDNL